MRPKILNNQFVYRIDNSNFATIMAYIGSEKNVVIPNQIEGKPVENIGAEAFASCELSSVTLPKHLKFISSWTFQNNNLTSIVIPNSVLYIFNWAFQNNNLTSIVIPNSVQDISAWAFQNNNLTEVVLPKHTKIDTLSFDQHVIINRKEIKK